MAGMNTCGNCHWFKVWVDDDEEDQHIRELIDSDLGECYYSPPVLKITRGSVDSFDTVDWAYPEVFRGTKACHYHLFDGEK